jgi:hypothetical protein
MPTLEQLPLISVVGPADQTLVEHAGQTCVASIATVLAGTQPQLTLASGMLLGRASPTVGGPENIGLGAGLSIVGGALVLESGAMSQLASPAFTGTPTAPTAAAGTASNVIATTAFVQAATRGQTLTLTGDINGSGSGTVATTLPAITTPGSYSKVTVNAKGQVIAGGVVLASDVSGLARVATSGSVADLTGSLGTIDVSNAIVVAQGGSLGRSLAVRAADIFNVLDFGAVADGATNASVAINAAIAAAAILSTGGEVYLPAGRYRIDLSVSPVLAKSNVMLRGAGRGRTLLLIDDSIATGIANAGLSNAVASGNFPAIADFHLRDLTMQGTRGKNGSSVTSAAFLVNLTNINNISVQDCEFLDSRGFSLGLFSGSDVMVRGNRVERSNADSIAVWDVSHVTISDNQIGMSGDDSISVHTNDATLAPLRAGVVISGNVISDGPGIHVLGAKSVAISGNVIRRARANGINVGFDPYFQQGDTPNFAVQIVDNVIEDVIDSSGFVAGSTPAYYILVGGSSKQPGGSASAPGTPVGGTGAVTPLYGSNTGNFYANGQTNTDGTHSVTGVTASPGGYWLRIEGNILVRTLPPVSAWSQWGYGAALQVGTSGVYSGSITEAMLNHPGIHLYGALRNSRIAGNIVQTTGPNGIEFDYNALVMDYDGLELVDNRIADFGQYGVFWPTSTLSSQRIRIARNDFDGDPYFRSTSRGANGSWTTTGSPHVGLYLAYLSGVEVTGNHFRNVGIPVAQSALATNVLRGNVVHCAPVATGYSASNQGVGTIPPSGPDFSHVIEICDPTSANYGQIASVSLATSAVQPTSGLYVAGCFVANATPGIVNGQAFLGWQRLTTGNAHVAGVDWIQVFGGTFYGATNSLPLPSVSNIYQATGAIAVSDKLALINAAAAVSMSLAAGSTDGQVLVIKRLGAGAVTLTATIDGTTSSSIVLNSASLKEAVSLTWSQSLATWLMI